MDHKINSFSSFYLNFFLSSSDIISMSYRKNAQLHKPHFLLFLLHFICEMFFLFFSSLLAPINYSRHCRRNESCLLVGLFGWPGKSWDRFPRENLLELRVITPSHCHEFGRRLNFKQAAHQFQKHIKHRFPSTKRRKILFIYVWNVLIRSLSGLLFSPPHRRVDQLPNDISHFSA